MSSCKCRVFCARQTRFRPILPASDWLHARCPWCLQHVLDFVRQCSQCCVDSKHSAERNWNRKHATNHHFLDNFSPVRRFGSYSNCHGKFRIACQLHFKHALGMRCIRGGSFTHRRGDLHYSSQSSGRSRLRARAIGDPELRGQSGFPNHHLHFDFESNHQHIGTCHTGSYS